MRQALRNYTGDENIGRFIVPEYGRKKYTTLITLSWKYETPKGQQCPVTLKFYTPKPAIFPIFINLGRKFRIRNTPKGIPLKRHFKVKRTINILHR